MDLILIAQSLIALFVAWIWVDYYRLIDIYDRTKLKFFLLVFALGGASTTLVLGAQHWFLDDLGFGLRNEWINDFLYSVFMIGAVEELAKLIPFLLLVKLFPGQFREPIDYVALICTSALGFSAVENILYFHSSGSELILARSVLSTIGHMFDTALIAYGFVLFKFRYNKKRIYLLPLFFFLAALSHGFYDFWLLYKGLPYGFLITILYFLISISLFALILNNALNNSSYFTYKKVINSHFVSAYMFTAYAFVIGAQFILLLFERDWRYALFSFQGNLLTVGLILYVSIVRLSRFKLIQGRWFFVKPELPFSLIGNNPYAPSGGLRLQIKGDPYNEAYVNHYYQEHFEMRPLSKRRSRLKTPKKAYIQDKIYLMRDQAHYVAKIFDEELQAFSETVMLIPKTFGKGMSKKGPIVGLYDILNPSEDLNPNWTAKDFRFVEWVVLCPLE